METLSHVSHCPAHHRPLGAPGSGMAPRVERPSDPKLLHRRHHHPLCRLGLCRGRRLGPWRRRCGGGACCRGGVRHTAIRVLPVCFKQLLLRPTCHHSALLLGDTAETVGFAHCPRTHLISCFFFLIPSFSFRSISLCADFARFSSSRSQSRLSFSCSFSNFRQCRLSRQLMSHPYGARGWFHSIPPLPTFVPSPFWPRPRD